ncbi:regulatory LuxR family protein [Mucilaginibacter gracilis]|uniref:Regulatory LuxR family protein n=1 Tax=Mucilaginibacter gracilis TaxID=423350 RepID=A0A495IT80_9SPHI|nr:helix-turn-helix transcriptional regulator [Mucilaginibacter gracilis]RKR79985.1 regulatory LuxR family protein [Mucilaginibacter gracilis]
MRTIKLQLPIFSSLMILIDVLYLTWQLFHFYFRPEDRRHWRITFVVLLLLIYNCAALYVSTIWASIGVNFFTGCVVALLLIRDRLAKKAKSGQPLSPALNENLSAFELKCIAYGLTHKEAEVTLLIAQGKTYEEIADVLFISKRTVESRAQSVYRKVGTSNRIVLVKKLDL